MRGGLAPPWPGFLRSTSASATARRFGPWRFACDAVRQAFAEPSRGWQRRRQQPQFGCPACPLPVARPGRGLWLPGLLRCMRAGCWRWYERPAAAQGASTCCRGWGSNNQRAPHRQCRRHASVSHVLRVCCRVGGAGLFFERAPRPFFKCPNTVMPARRRTPAVVGIVELPPRGQPTATSPSGKSPRSARRVARAAARFIWTLVDLPLRIAVRAGQGEQ